MNALRPYRAAFASRFQAMLSYRSAALAGVVTQCWWGATKIMVLGAFYGVAGSEGTVALSLPNAITYIWLSQALLALLPWSADPLVVDQVRSGAVAYDRLRPVHEYAFWYARSAGWIGARTLPRALLLAALTALGLPALGLGQWAWQAPQNASAALGFAISLALALGLSSALSMLINVVVVALLDDRGINALVTPVVLVFSGNLLPLALFPERLSRALLWQPCAGLLDIPLRIYLGDLAGWRALLGLALQLFWTLLLVFVGQRSLMAALRRIELQGG